MPVLWREIQRQNFTNWHSLALYLELDRATQERLIKAPSFPLNLPRRLAAKIVKHDLDDPILKQFLPLQEEEEFAPGFFADPVEDDSFLKGKRLLQKYRGRVLIVTTGRCAMNCRFCFRQHFPYGIDDKEFSEALLHIKGDPSISEVILSGGDPLSLSTERLSALCYSLQEIPHVKRLRFHTRFPIGIPERIDEKFLSLLASLKLQSIFALHVNCIQELDQEIIDSLKPIQRLGIPLVSQTVLLKGVNDSTEALYRLFEFLIDRGIMPYYLHQLDRVQGAARFEVEESRGIQLIEELRALLPGYAVPRYVKEVPHAPSKAPVVSCNQRLATKGHREGLGSE